MYNKCDDNWWKFTWVNENVFINKNIFKEGLYISKNMKNIIFNELKDKYDYKKIQFDEDKLKSTILNKIKEANNFVNQIIILLILFFSLSFTNLELGDVLILRLLILAHIGYKSFKNNYDGLNLSVIKIVIVGSLLIIPIKNHLMTEEVKITKIEVYDFFNDLKQVSNNENLIFNTKNNVLYNLNKELNKNIQINEFKKECALVQIDYSLEARVDKSNDTIRIKEKLEDDMIKGLIGERTLSCIELNVKK